MKLTLFSASHKVHESRRKFKSQGYILKWKMFKAHPLLGLILRELRNVEELALFITCLSIKDDLCIHPLTLHFWQTCRESTLNYEFFHSSPGVISLNQIWACILGRTISSLKLVQVTVGSGCWAVLSSSSERTWYQDRLCESWLCHPLAVWSWTNYLTFLSWFSVCQIEMMKGGGWWEA